MHIATYLILSAVQPYLIFGTKIYYSSNRKLAKKRYEILLRALVSFVERLGLRIFIPETRLRFSDRTPTVFQYLLAVF
jgi:hypothetical protein